MYIHKIEQDRRFCCPFCKCDEKRDFVAMSVTDEIVALPGDPLVGLGKAQGKRALEMAVFESFASASGIRLDVASVRNVDPPHPDIFCTIACKPHWFELGRIISEELAAKINPRRYKSEGAFSFSQESAFTKIVAKKAKKSYETRGAPVDLILHFDLRLGTNSAISGLINQDAKLLQPLTKNGRFARVWIFDEWAKSILWPLTLS